jgi:hypothetical protein
MKRLLVMAVLVVTALGFSVTTGVAASSGVALRTRRRPSAGCRPGEGAHD